MLQPDSYKEKGARKLLVKELKGKGITDERVLTAIGEVARHQFIHKDFKHLAYHDKAFPIGEGQTISQPYTVAYQTQMLHPEVGDKVLEIGTGSGYQAAILVKLGVELFSIERQPKLYAKTKKLFEDLNLKANLILGDGSLGLPTEAPFDRIIVTAGAPKIPDTLINQLAFGGIMIIPVGNNTHQTMHILIKKPDGNLENISLDQFSFVPLIGSQAW
jgi:protein-L-isoaspartate(D-aspartate) O-methyltransferase